MLYFASDTRYDSMTYNRAVRSGLKLPAISLGWWYNFGSVDRLENSHAAVSFGWKGWSPPTW